MKNFEKAPPGSHRDRGVSYPLGDSTFLNEMAVKATIQKLYDSRLSHNYDKADDVLKSCLYIEKNERLRGYVGFPT